MQLKIDELLNSGRDLIEKNMPVILTGVGVVGTITTAVLAGQASFRAAQVIADEKEKRVLRASKKKPDEKLDEIETLMMGDKVKLVWPLYIPPALSGTGTVAAIIMANRASASQAAVLAAAYGLSEKRLEEYKGKVSEKLTKNKATEINDEIAQDRVNKNPPGGNIVVMGGEVLCQDAQTGRYFTSPIEKIHKRLNELNDELINHDYASVGWFFESFGLAPTNVTNELGWNRANDGLVDLSLSTVLADEERPCVVVDFMQQPHLNYNIRSYA